MPPALLSRRTRSAILVVDAREKAKISFLKLFRLCAMLMALLHFCSGSRNAQVYAAVRKHENAPCETEKCAGHFRNLSKSRKISSLKNVQINPRSDARLYCKEPREKKSLQMRAWRSIR